jgi:hypothetical protein
MRKIILSLILVVLVFYYIYPQALAVRGSSFILASGVLGLGLFFYNGMPYSEIMKIVGGYATIFFACLFTGFMVNYYDPFMTGYPKTQFAWVFSAYLVIYVFFLAYPRGTLIQFLYFVIAAIFLQCLITIVMYYNDAARAFFNSLQLTDWLAEAKRQETEGSRLLGYGTAFFGAGLVCGLGLILIVYVLMAQKLKLWVIIILAIAYAFIFYVGLLSARTTIVGLIASMILFIFLIFKGKVSMGQSLKFLGLCAILASIGYTLCYMYFPEFSDWAFELFINYEESGEIRTNSSDGLDNMFMLPPDFDVWLRGYGGMTFWGSDVGYTRLLFYFGLPGTFAYFFCQFVLMRMSFTRESALNLTLLTIYAYNLALNVKGLSDLNPFFMFFVFYFLHYQYYIYTPYLQRLGKFNSTKLRYAVQSSTPRRRV